ncbi:conserved hypothetical protein [Methanoregula boonei 6A8]|jgi:MFS family permease|uniref:Intracellular septation protein A n=1 Tax=Methanoregula boonei (strain DSM 21154 / JCM 14090 / 6A8) TaxID=456442 RepID=A7I5A4_METB6|nr:hypothetical protein [Methanoregula boonei]ABS54915.1 conserved hypothetical protein [Methanoregula boonei 6A8]
MKNGGVLLGFLPLVIYGVIAGIAGTSVSGVMIALIAAIAAFLIVGRSDLRKGMMMAWVNVAIFSVSLIAIGVFGIAWLIPYMGILIYTTLAVFTVGSILIGRPFTLQYAREMVDRTLWEKPRFIRANVLITGVWGGVFLVNLGFCGIAFLTPTLIGRIAQVSTYIFLAAAALFTFWYPEHVRKKIPVMVQ